MMTRSSHKLDGLPNDLLSSDIENERKLKVINASDIDTDSVLAKLLNEISSTNKEVLNQLILLNARIEEAFNTRIGEIDIE